MPAAAVIPAPIAYIKVVAVKKLVVGFFRAMSTSVTYWSVFDYSQNVTLRKLECLKQIFVMYILAWNNKKD